MTGRIDEPGRGIQAKAHSLTIRNPVSNAILKCFRFSYACIVLILRQGRLNPHSIIGHQNLNQVLSLGVIGDDDSICFARMDKYVIHYLVETIAHRLKKRSLHFRLMNQHFYQAAINLLYVLLVEHLNTDIATICKVLM